MNDTSGSELARHRGWTLVKSFRESIWLADITLLAVAVIWGVNIPIVKYATAHVDHLVFNAVRLTMGTFALWLFAWLNGRGKPRPPVPWLQVVAIAVIGSLLYQYMFIEGIKRATAGDTGLILGTIPMWTAALAWVCRVEKLKIGAWLGLVLAAIGTVIVTFRKDGLDFTNAASVGNLIMLSAAVLWGIATVLIRQALNTVSPIRLAFLMTLIVLPAHWLLAWPYLSSWDAADWTIWVAVVYSGVFSTGIAYALWNLGIKLVGPSHAAAFQNAAPVIALVASWLTLSEPVLATQLIGGPLIIGGLVVMRRYR